MPKWVGLHGYEVECIMLDHRQVLRVSQRIGGRRCLIGYCPTVEAVAGMVDLATLVEVVEFRR